MSQTRVSRQGLDFVPLTSSTGALLDLSNAAATAAPLTDAVAAPAVLKLNERASLVNFGLTSNPLTAIDDVLEKAMYASAFDNIAIDIPAREDPYLVGNIIVPQNPVWNVNPQPLGTYMVRLHGQTGATLKKVSSVDNGYLLAPGNWVDETGFANGPIHLENLVLDGAGIAQDTAVTGFWGASFVNVVFRGATRHGAYSPSMTRSGGAMGGSTVTPLYERCDFYMNGSDGLSLEDISIGTHYITDGWLSDCRAYNNGRYQFNMGQAAGWKLCGNHAWSTATVANATIVALSRMKDALGAMIGPNIWEGLFTVAAPDQQYGLLLDGGYGAVDLNAQTFLRGLGLKVNFTGPADVVKVRGSIFVGADAHIMHARNASGYTLESEGNVFECTTPYRFSGGAGHFEAIVADRDRIQGVLPLFDGEQREGLYSIWQPNKVQYPATNANSALFYRSGKVQRYTGAITADRDLTLPASPYNGMEYTVVRASTATGAFSIVIKTSGGTPVVNIAVSKYATVKYDGAAWVVVSTGDTL